MMGLSERVSYVVLGLVIGFIVGYMVRVLQDINHKEDEVLELLHEQEEHESNRRDEFGMIRIPTWTQVKRSLHWQSMRDRITLGNIALFLVVAITAYSAVHSQKNNDELQEQTRINAETSKNVEAVTECTSDYLGKMLGAVNERTTYASEQAKANITLQKAQATFVEQALREPALEASRVAAALRAYRSALEDFIEIQQKSLGKQINNPYPSEGGFQQCLDREVSSK